MTLQNVGKAFHRNSLHFMASFGSALLALNWAAFKAVWSHRATVACSASVSSEIYIRFTSAETWKHLESTSPDATICYAYGRR